MSNTFIHSAFEYNSLIKWMCHVFVVGKLSPKLTLKVLVTTIDALGQF